MVGEGVRRARQSRGWTQAHLAEQAGFSPNYIARLERGELGPSLFVAAQLCETLGIDLASLTQPTVTRTTRRRVAG
jgi:transcriptional regulator with XRE-family HTH domain